jgi:hypothetical protein
MGGNAIPPSLTKAEEDLPLETKKYLGAYSQANIAVQLGCGVTSGVRDLGFF